jgi:protein-tyrosine-phosphatase
MTAGMPGDLPSAVLFACTQNAIRSVMAAHIMKHYYGHRVYVASCGVRPGEADPFVHEVMDEIGIDIGKHRPQGFDDLEDSSFDLVISLSPEAHHRALELTRTMAIEAEYWPTIDPSDTYGSRDQVLDSYRAVRDQLSSRIRARFGRVLASGV